MERTKESKKLTGGWEKDQTGDGSGRDRINSQFPLHRMTKNMIPSNRYHQKKKRKGVVQRREEDKRIAYD